MLHLYIFLSRIFYFIAPIFITIRKLRGKEHHLRYKEKLGHYQNENPYSHDFTIHIHGASLGETLSSFPVIHKLHALYPEIKFIITSGTKASGLVMEKKLPDYAVHYFAPLDTPKIVERFLDHIKPNLTIIIDSEIWPNFLLKAQERGLPVFALNMRFSERSRKRWMLFKSDFQKIMCAYKGFFVQNDITAHFIRQVSNKTMRICSNLKWAQQAEQCSPTILSSYQSLCRDKPIILLASTHDDEEVQLSTALKNHNLNAKIIIMPRHPERGKEIQQALEIHNIISDLRSENADLESDNIYIADTLGEMSLWASLSDIIIMGKTFDEIGGGHNIIESAIYKNAILCGPKMQNFTEVLTKFQHHNAIITTESAEGCALKIKELLESPQEIKAYAERAYALYEKNHKNALSFLHDLTPYITAAKNETPDEST